MLEAGEGWGWERGWSYNWDHEGVPAIRWAVAATQVHTHQRPHARPPPHRPPTPHHLASRVGQLPCERQARVTSPMSAVTEPGLGIPVFVVIAFCGCDGLRPPFTTSKLRASWCFKNRTKPVQSWRPHIPPKPPAGTGASCQLHGDETENDRPTGRDAHACWRHTVRSPSPEVSQGPKSTRLMSAFAVPGLPGWAHILNLSPRSSKTLSCVLESENTKQNKTKAQLSDESFTRSGAVQLAILFF